MKPLRVNCALLAVLVLAGVSQSRAQDLPKTQPKVLTIVREHVKVGRQAEHAKFEAGYPAALEKGKSTDYYLAMTSLTGSNEAWYIIPNESFRAIGESMKHDEKDPVLSAAIDRLDLADAEYLTASERIRAVARPDLSSGDFPDISKARFFEIDTYYIRPGGESIFEETAKAYGAAAKRAAPKSSYRVYQVVAGLPLPAFLIFTSVEDFAEFDQGMADFQATMKGATPEEAAVFKKFGDVVQREENNQFRLDPVQSYVSKQTREKDPEFWMPK